MDFDIRTLGFAMGSAWLSGINLYATVLTLGLLQRFHLVKMPGEMAYLSHDWILGLAAVLTVIEFVADKVPAVDSLWDAVHTFIRIPAGGILAATAFAHFDPSVRLAAVLLGGGLALSSHGAKSATRLAVNTSPEPFSNWIMSFLGDLIAVGGTVLMVVNPALIIAIVVVGLIVSVLLFRWIYRALKRLLVQRRQPVKNSL